MIGAGCLSVTKVIISATVRFIYNLSAKLAPLSLSLFCPGLSGSIGSSLLEILIKLQPPMIMEKKTESDRFRPIVEFTIWRNLLDGEVPQK